MDEYVVIQQLLNLYCFDMTRYRYMSPDGKYHTMKIPYDETVLFEHLDGKKTVCVYAKEKNTIFHCFDVDEPDPDKIHKLVNKLVGCGIQRDFIYVSTSGNKGYHVEIFFDRPVWKSLAENFFNYLMRDPEIASIKMECKPGRNGAIKLPLGINFKTGRRCWYVDQDTLAPIESMDYIFCVQKMSAEDFEQIVYICNKEKKIEDIELAKQKTIKRTKPRKIPLRNEPVITALGQRHDKMLQKAVWLRCVGGEAEDIFEELINWVNRQDMSLIGSNWKEIEEDAYRMANDVVKHYEPKVTMRKHSVRHSQKLDRTDIQIILNAPTRSARKVAFLICASIKVFGVCSIGYDRIAQILGITTPTAFNSVKALIESGVVRKRKTGGVIYTDGEPRLVANEYVLCDDLPVYESINIKCECPVSMGEINSSFNDNYYGALMKMCDADTLSKYMTKSELEECMKYGAEGAVDGA